MTYGLFDHVLMAELNGPQAEFLYTLLHRQKYIVIKGNTLDFTALAFFSVQI